MVTAQPSEHHDYLLILREIFRERMQEEDFCIGGEQVEKLFRELLGEPEPVPPTYDGPVSNIKAADVAEIMSEHFKKLGDVFDRDDTFYTNLKRNR